MDTQHLKAFVRVADLGSFSAAADTLHLTQPAVSKRIAALEQQLQCSLFDRISRVVTLTEAGRALLPYARDILRNVYDAERMIIELSGEVRGSLKLSTSHHIGLHRLPKVLKRFCHSYPEVALDLAFQDSEKANERVLHGETELAVITLPPEPHPKLVTQALWRDPLYFVAAHNHPLSQMPELTLKALSDYEAILPETSTYTTSLVKSIFEKQGLNLQLTMATNFMETIKMMVGIGLGWSLLPESLVDADEHTVLNINAPVERILGSVYHKERSLSNASQAFLELLKQYADSTPIVHSNQG
ncbi:LysR family transcriptional regulator [Marinibactrum halimedae]|nr:LysR family transcriptional regulator [Marinibactrum halimedae]MCD9459403.1 LysR family transcriptional regulator [Marinibactrum halimedae]